MQQFQQLNGPMRTWVVLHPFAAKRGQAMSLRALAITDSIGQVGVLGTDYNGGKLDAFRHVMWMALLTKEWPAWKAASLGRAYERGNRRDFRRGKLEDGGMQDAVAREMDLRNNKIGCALGIVFRRNPQAELILAIAGADFHGRFYTIRKDANGQSLDAAGKIIPPEEWQGRWRTRRCLQYDPYIPEI